MKRSARKIASSRNLTKKAISCFLILTMLLSCVATMNISVFAADATGETKLLDTNDKASITKAGFTADEKNVKTTKYSAKWEVSKEADKPVKGFPTDFSKHDTINFSIKIESSEDAAMMLYIGSENKDTDGIDYYGKSMVLKPGEWKTISYKFSELSKNRTPLGWNQITDLSFRTKGWSNKAAAGTVVYIENMYLSGSATSVPVVSATPAPVVDDNAPVGTKVFYNNNFDNTEADAFAGLSSIPKSNEIKLQTEEGNSYLSIKMADPVTEDGYIDMPIVGSTRYMVVEASISTAGEALGGDIQYKDNDSKTKSLMKFGGTGLVTADGKVIAPIKKGTWSNIALVLDLAKATFNVYAEGKLVQSNLPITNAELSKGMKSLRFYAAKGGSGKTLLIDNYKVYEGKTPREIKADEGPKPGDVPTPTTNPTNLAIVDNAVCLKLDVPYALVNKARKPIDANNQNVVPYTTNGRTLVPLRFIAESMGAQVAYEDATAKITITLGSDKIELAVGSDQLIKNGTAKTIDVPASITADNRTFVPLRAVAEAFGKEVFWDDMGLIVLSDKKNIFNRDTDLALMLNVMAEFVYDRPVGEKIIEDLKSNSPSHPRLLANKADFDRIRSLYGTDEVYKGWVDVILKRADSYLSAKDPTYNVDVGGRLTSTGTSPMMQALGLAYQVTGDKKYVDAAYKHLEVICGFANWHPGHFLDAAGMMQGVAIGYDWMYDAFTAEQRKVIEEGLYKHAIKAGLGAYEGTKEDMEPKHGTFGRSGWTKTENNWNAVCNSGLTMASVAIGDIDTYKADITKLMGQVIRSIEIGVRCYAPDGGYGESPGYWSYGTNNLILMLASLTKAMGTNYGIFNAPGLDQTGYFPNYVESTTNGSWNYHDSAEGFIDNSTLFWFASALDDPNLAGIRYQDMVSTRKNPSINDIIWYNPEKINKDVKMPLDKLFKGIDTATMRSSWTDASVVFTGLHGGNNAMNHGNLDAGNFILDAGAERWIVDLGSDYYNLPGYFGVGTGGARWNYYRGRAEGQNTIVINPGMAEDQVAKSVSPITALESKNRGAYSVVDMKPAHGADKVNSAIRGLWLTDNRKAVVVQDEISLVAPSEVWWFAHTKGSIEVAADGKSAIITQNGKRMWAGIVSPMADAKFIKMGAESLPTSPKATEGEYSRSAYFKLAVHMSGVKDYKLAVVFKQLESNQTKPEFEYNYTAIADWKVPDGDIVTPRLSDLQLDGKTIEGFNPETTQYKVILPYGETAVPQISASVDRNYVVEVNQLSALPGVATVKVSSADDASMYSVYTLTIRAKQEIEITASGYQEGNGPENSMDGELGSRWAADGEQWIMYTFAQPRELSSVGLAWWQSDKRSTIFDILISTDGINFTTVFSGKQSVKEDKIETYTFDKTKVVAVKIVGHGNTSNAWNSLLEIEFK